MKAIFDIGYGKNKRRYKGQLIRMNSRTVIARAPSGIRGVKGRAIKRHREKHRVKFTG